MKKSSAVIKWTVFIALTIVLILFISGIGGLIPNRLARPLHWALAAIWISIFAIVGSMLIIRVIQPIIRGVKRLKQKAGILLIIIGIFIPSIFYPFLSLNLNAKRLQGVALWKGGTYQPTFRDFEIVFVEGEYIAKKNDPWAGDWKGRCALPYQYTVAFGIIFVFIGIPILAFSYKTKTNDLTETKRTG